jgi:hypothetical protein
LDYEKKLLLRRMGYDADRRCVERSATHGTQKLEVAERISC